MELNEKLQELRKQKGLTQEELAGRLHVSRAAVSKWESGRGYPSIDSLKAMARLFSVSVDSLISGEELLTVAREENRKRENSIKDLVFGLLDLSVAMFFFLPFFGQKVNGQLQEVSLFGLTEISGWLWITTFGFVVGILIIGLLTLTLQNFDGNVWIKSKYWVSLGLNVIAASLFILCQQPYAAIFLFIYLIIKFLMLINKR